MHLATMPLEMLRPAPYNQRVELEPGDRRYRKLRRSVEQFGLVEPLVWNQRTGFVVGGHQRLRILRDLGWMEAPVSVVDLPPERERALNVVLNNREAQSNWDMLRLTQILEELSEASEQLLQASGFEASSLNILRSQLAPAAEPLSSPQEPELMEVTLTIPAVAFETVRPELDALVRRFDLATHWRGR